LFFFKKQIPLPVRIFIAIVVFYFAIATGPVGDARYRMIVFPEMIFAGGIALYKSIKNKND
jgi:hypothetical protein